ncbi:hypothetical protein [Rahnella sp. PCH160]|uniref:hypothetical protein n=1 Tax=Rahnella sp. PCH160 TaxID=3447928 RepID=UPI0039FCC64D
MQILTNYREKVMPSGITGRDKTMKSRSMNINPKRFDMLKNNFFIFTLLLIVILFSHFAHSANTLLCSPSNGTIPSIHIQADIYAPPAGSLSGMYYFDSTPAMMPGPISCPTYTPTGYTAYAVNANGVVGWGVYTVKLDYGFQLAMAIGTTPGLKGNETGNWFFSGNTVNIPQVYYPGFIIFPPPDIANTQDLEINNLLIGYMATAGEQGLPTGYSNYTDEMTAVYLSGRVHFPPYCRYCIFWPIVNTHSGRT